MLFAGARRRCGGFEKRHQHRRAADQFVQLALYKLAAGTVGQQGVKLAREADRLRAVAAFQRGFFEPAVRAQRRRLCVGEPAGKLIAAAAALMQRRVAFFQHCLPQIRPIGDEAIDTHVDQAQHVFAPVHRPGNHLEAAAVRVFHECGGEFLKMR